VFQLALYEEICSDNFLQSVDRGTTLYPEKPTQHSVKKTALDLSFHKSPKKKIITS